jgi:hypothetical protein
VAAITEGLHYQWRAGVYPRGAGEPWKALEQERSHGVLDWIGIKQQLLCPEA